jgi:hypothetical protein
MKVKLILIIISTTMIFASGGFDNGTSTGKGLFQIDLTLNPFNSIKFGQSYAIISYGVTKNFDIHGYVSQHPEKYKTFYAGLFYQFIRTDKFHLATAIGLRTRDDNKINHIFLPQILYTSYINDKLYVGGSLVNVYSYNNKKNYGNSIDLGLFYKFNYSSKIIKSISFGVSAFHPTTWKPKTYFLPTYSLDIKFNS